MAFPLGAIYVIALFGNGIILSTIKSEWSLHIPMYYFLCMLALADMGLALCTLPSMLGIFWFNYKFITFDACLVQMYFIHTFSAIESGVLVAMAFDRVLAIWSPLRYGTILTNAVVCRAGTLILMRAVCVVFPVPFLIKRLPFYRSNILSHSFCLHQDVMHLACASTRVNSLYGLTAVIFTKGSDSLSILLSYVFILRTVMAITSGDGRLKALNTCVSHICAVLIFYVPLIGVSVIHRFGKHLSPLTHALMANAYLLVPPVLNPIVYTVKTKEIRRKIIQIFVRSKITACSQSTMVLFNNTTSSSTNFLLTAFPGLEVAHVWISIPICCLYTIALLGNSMILLVISVERGLHKPMYYFISMLSAVDLCLTGSTLPTVLGVLWFHTLEISFKACFIQMSLVHVFSFLESSVLAAMAFDRFMAICNPLKYAMVLTDMIIMVIGLVMCIRQVIFMFLMFIVLKNVSFQGGQELSHPFCYHPDILKYTHSNPWISSFLGMFFQLYITGTDLLFILFSYVLILRTVLSTVAPKKQQKAFNTCVCHICAVTVFYAPMISLSLTHRLLSTTPRVVCSILANMYLLLPPVLNPVIYSWKTRMIRQAMFQLLRSKRVQGAPK
ncbi:Olfactory receptor 51T1 [Galemys pyrenaicus]|uniref:Olfactory receptor 51T1 n=1 Tax=Galemys pyrenaicus TaxID=202257 RepID=A0A8J6AKX3_GALPY|nr:Olfactory receptor 51T1 [Galemys pyrenaicus]